MAVQFAPIASLALRYGVVALATYAATRRLSPGRLSQPVEDEMDATPEGLHLCRGDGQINAAGRWARVVRLGRTGPGLHVDAALLGRLRVVRAK